MRRRGILAGLAGLLAAPKAAGNPAPEPAAPHWSWYGRVAEAVATGRPFPPIWMLPEDTATARLCARQADLATLRLGRELAELRREAAALGLSRPGDR